jgi:uncharacterized protein
MSAPGAQFDRRSVLRALGLLGGLAVIASCSASFADVRLKLATGASEGGYFALGTALATAWHRELELRAKPDVLATKGSIDNLRLLAAGSADLVFCQVDVVADRIACCPLDDPRSPRALARIYDDVVHVVVPASSSIGTLAQLRGARVSVGDPDSGVYFIAKRLLAAARIPENELRVVQWGIGESVTAMAAGEIDAFFWSGSLPTQGVTTLAAQLPIRLLDLSDTVGPMRANHPGYASGTIPAGSYGIPAPVVSLLVRNVLLVGTSMPDEMAGALVKALFATQEELTKASRAALTIDPRAAIGTQPVLLHPGAEQFFRTADSF